MKKLKKLLIRITLVIVILLVAAFLMRNVIARKAVEIGTKQVTGFPLEIASVNLGVFGGTMEVRGLKLMNPPDFHDRMFVDLPLFKMDYRTVSMLRGAPHINDMLVDINHLTLVKNAAGESNAMKLKGMVSSDKPSTTKYRVDKLRVHVGSVTIKDFSRAKPTERTLNLNVNATYDNITDSTDISRLVLLTVANQVSLPDIGIKTEDLKKGLSTTTESLEKAGKGVLDTLKKAIPGK